MNLDLIELLAASDSATDIMSDSKDAVEDASKKLEDRGSG